MKGRMPMAGSGESLLVRSPDRHPQHLRAIRIPTVIAMRARGHMLQDVARQPHPFERAGRGAGRIRTGGLFACLIDRHPDPVLTSPALPMAKCHTDRLSLV